MATLLLRHSCRVTLQMPARPFVQPAGTIPKPQWQEIREEGERRPERKNRTLLSGRLEMLIMLKVRPPI